MKESFFAVQFFLNNLESCSGFLVFGCFLHSFERCLFVFLQKICLFSFHMIFLFIFLCYVVIMRNPVPLYSNHRVFFAFVYSNEPVLLSMPASFTLYA